MKTIYIILFLTDALLLVLQSFLFLRLLDNNESGLLLAAIILGIFICIAMLVYFLGCYLKVPGGKGHK